MKVDVAKIEEAAEQRSKGYQDLLCSKNYSAKNTIQNGNAAADYKVGFLVGAQFILDLIKEENKGLREFWLDIATQHGDPCDFISEGKPHELPSSTNIHVQEVKDE